MDRQPHQRLSLAVKYSTVLFPFDTVAFARALPEHGFVVPEVAVSNSPGTQVQVSGIIGRKLDTSLRIDPGRQVVAVDASDVETLLREMEAVESLIRDHFSIESSEVAQYYEFVAELTLKAKRNPVEIWPTHFRGVRVVSQLSRILGRNLSPFGVRLSSEGQEPNQVDWFEARIEPSLPSSKSHHFVQLVLRNPEREIVSAFARTVERTVADVLTVIEEV